MDRRVYLSLLGATTISGVSGCVGGDSDGENAETATEQNTATPEIEGSNATDTTDSSDRSDRDSDATPADEQTDTPEPSESEKRLSEERDAVSDRIERATELLDRALDAFRDGEDGTILDTGYDERLGWKDENDAIREAEDVLQDARSSIETDQVESEFGHVIEIREMELHLTEEISRRHRRDLVPLWDDCFAASEYARDRTLSGLSRSITNLGNDIGDIENSLSYIERRWNELRDFANEDTLRSEYYGEKSQQLVDVHEAAESFLDGLNAAYNGLQHLDEISRWDHKVKCQRHAGEAIQEFEQYEETAAAIDTHPSLDDGLETAVEDARELQDEADSMPDDCVDT